MKNDLTCGVVRDLLPSYVEGLLGEESQRAVERHLEGCPECAARKAAMSAPADAAEDNAKEVDYLKRVKRRSVRRVALAVVCTALVLLGGFALKIFVIGTPLQAEYVAVAGEEVRDEGKTLYLDLWSMGSANAFHSWKLETVDGVTSIYARDVLASPLYPVGQAQLYVPLEGVREVWLGGTSGKLVWQDGMAITQECLDLLALRTPYCGDAPALGRIAQALDLRERLGGYTTELQTSQRPYGWTLVCESIPLSDSMTRCEFLMLSLVDNLDFVRFRESGEKSTVLRTATLDSADGMLEEMTALYNRAHGTDWTAKASVKDYANTPADFQRFLSVIDHCSTHGLELIG